MTVHVQFQNGKRRWFPLFAVYLQGPLCPPPATAPFRASRTTAKSLASAKVPSRLFYWGHAYLAIALTPEAGGFCPANEGSDLCEVVGAAALRLRLGRLSWRFRGLDRDVVWQLLKYERGHAGRVAAKARRLTSTAHHGQPADSVPSHDVLNFQNPISSEASHNFNLASNSGPTLGDLSTSAGVPGPRDFRGVDFGVPRAPRGFRRW